MAFSKITLNGNTLMDVTGDTVVASHLLENDTATGADGEQLTGTLQVQSGTQEFYEFPDMYVGNRLNNSDGGLTATGDGCTSDYVRISPYIVGTTLYYCSKNTFGAGCSVAFYASDKSFISSANNGDDTLVSCTIPATAVYYRLGCMKTSKSLVYVKYDVDNAPRRGLELTDKVQDNVNAVYAFPEFTDGQFLQWSDGGVGSSSGYCCSDYIPISPDINGEMMEYSAKISSSAAASVVFYASDRSAISPYYRVWNDNAATAIIPSTAKYFRICCVTASEDLAYAKYYADNALKNLYRELWELKKSL